MREASADEARACCTHLCMCASPWQSGGLRSGLGAAGRSCPTCMSGQLCQLGGTAAVCAKDASSIASGQHAPAIGPASALRLLLRAWPRPKAASWALLCSMRRCRAASYSFTAATSITNNTRWISPG